MQCRNCGTEIADKAIVCYRCGTPTTDPVRKPGPVAPTRNPLLSFVVAVLLVLLALYLGYAGRTSATPERWQTAAGILAGAALMIVVLRLLLRGR